LQFVLMCVLLQPFVLKACMKQQAVIFFNEKCISRKFGKLCEAGHSPASSAKVKNNGSYISIPLYIFTACFFISTHTFALCTEICIGIIGA
jgi:hypothetical protein